MSKQTLDFIPPSPPLIGFNVGVTGHRDANPDFSANRARIEKVLSEILAAIDSHFAAVDTGQLQSQKAKIKLHSLLVDGLDQIAAQQAFQRGWDVVAPLPFGRALNITINAHPVDHAEALALLTGEGQVSAATTARVAAINGLVEKAHCFELAEQDDALSALFLAKQAAPDDVSKALAYSFASSQRVVLAAQVMIEQCDLIIGVWDGVSTSYTGGTGHTIALALSMGAPVLWIDAKNPESWSVLQSPEALGSRHQAHVGQDHALSLLKDVMDGAILPGVYERHNTQSSHLEGVKALSTKSWRKHSNPFWHGYRRVEAIAGAPNFTQQWRNLTQTYETPDQILTGSAGPVLKASVNLPGHCATFVANLGNGIFRRFAWADGISSRLSDIYRGGMTLSFLFSAFAIVGGIAYLPFATAQEKWFFAIFELLLLAGILAITFVGQRRRWHGRWFETRRVAEYLRSAPLLLLLGVARPIGRWPKGAHTSWPEWYVRQAFRNVGLPAIAVSPDYLRQALENILSPHIVSQSAYHQSKAKRLAQAHHRLDHLSELLFKLAVASVGGYLVLKLGGFAHLIDKEVAVHFSKLFTFLGVLLPTFGGAIAGIRYFGDFERFSAISEVASQRLDAIQARIELLLAAPNEALTYDYVAQIAHAIDDVVIGEIESWQAVFSGKQISVPV